MKIKILIVLLIPFLGFGQIINHNNNDFKICNDGNFIIVGTESIEDHQLGTKKTNGYIIKTNKDGNIIWKINKTSSTIGEAHRDGFLDKKNSISFSSVEISSEGDFIVAGDIFDTKRGYGLFLVKVDKNGNTIWENKIFSQYRDWKNHLFYEETTMSLDICENGEYIIARNLPHSSHVVELLKINQNGNKIWSREFYSSSVGSIKNCPDGGIILAGGYWKDNDCYNENCWHASLLKLNKDGVITWRKTYQRKFATDFASIELTANGEFILIGRFGTKNYQTTPYIFKIDKSGNEIWKTELTEGTIRKRQWDDKNSDIYKGKDIHIYSDGRILVLCNYLFQNSVPNKNIYLFNLNNDGNINSINNLSLDESISNYEDGEILQIDSEKKINVLKAWVDVNDLNIMSRNHYFIKTNSNGKVIKIPLTDRIKSLIEAKFNIWQSKGEYEKTSDYNIRIKKDNWNKNLSEIQNETFKKFKESYINELTKKIFTIKKYDSDNETFLLELDSKQYVVSVPIDNAKFFKNNFKNSSVKFHDCILLNDTFVLSSFDILLNNDKYTYNISNSNKYQTTLFDYNFTSLNLKLNETISSSQNITYRKIEKIGHSSIDIDIPNNLKLKNRYAIIIGNENYSSFQKTLDKEQDVPYAVNDASLFKEYALKTLGVEEDNLYYLENATTGQMNQTIDLVSKILNKLGEKSELIFYYAGHGFPDELTKEPYLIPVDVSTSYLNNAVSLDDLYEKFSKTGAKRILAFVDACFSGGARENSLLVSRGVKINPKMTNISNNLVVISASSETQSALPYDEQRHGMFTFYLLKKFKESSCIISLGDLYDYLREEVSLNSLKINQTEQDPNVIYSPKIENKWRDWQLY